MFFARNVKSLIDLSIFNITFLSDHYPDLGSEKPSVLFLAFWMCHQMFNQDVSLAIIVCVCVCVYLLSCMYLVVTYRKRAMLVLPHFQIYYYPLCFWNHEYFLHKVYSRLLCSCLGSCILMSLACRPFQFLLLSSCISVVPHKQIFSVKFFRDLLRLYILL